MVAQNLVDINVETGIVVATPPPTIEETSPALRLKLNWSVEISWSPQHSTRLAILPNGKVVVALPHKRAVLLFNKEGKAKGHLGTFENPHGVTAMEGGKMAVLDDKRIVVFSKSGEKQEVVPQGLNTAAGLSVDQEGVLVTINRYRREFFFSLSLLDSDYGKLQFHRRRRRTNGGTCTTYVYAVHIHKH